ncbi:MAG: elongation factor P [Patescibacteria group bacterium]|nr:elongation factor P [Patescibacteria group bacterium]MCL5432133.1 elongation factor P [Patescibacteria group bacterium]
MINVTDLRAGIVFEDPSTGSGHGPWVVLKYEHVKMGRGTATIKVKIRNLLSGATIEKAFINGARVQDVNLEKRKAQYLYQDASGYVFMDPVSYEQFPVDGSLVGDYGKFLKEGTEVDLKFYNDKAISIALPLKMKFMVTDTEPGFKGNSVTNIYKEAQIETGAKIKVPLFVETGQEVLVNTETGDYVERVK